MLVENKTHKLNFGWKHTTHRLISKNTAKRFNSIIHEGMEISRDILDDSCVAPDYSRKVLPGYIRGHFADIDNLSSNPPDAFYLLKRYTKKALESHKKAQDPKFSRESLNKRDNYVGYALHFLQDMLNPHHVDFAPLPKGHPMRVKHTAFEKLAQKIEKDVISKFHLPNKPEEQGFWNRTLSEAMKQTKKRWDSIKNLDNSKEYIQKVARESLITTYETTDAYLGFLAKKFNEISYKHNSARKLAVNTKILNPDRREQVKSSPAYYQEHLNF